MALLSSLRRVGETSIDEIALTKARSSRLSIMLVALLPLVPTLLVDLNQPVQ
jgi:hypothetical protein